VSRKFKARTAKKKVRKEKTRKKNIVEVSSDNEKFYKKDSSRKKLFAIQVVSHDTKVKALNEIKKLKKLNYKAFIENSVVNGRKYFRVRIGPIASKQKALRTLNEIQNLNRYEESYMIKE